MKTERRLSTEKSNLPTLPEFPLLSAQSNETMPQVLISRGLGLLTRIL